MCTSNKRTGRSPRALKTLLVYLAVSGLCILINAVYSIYGHGVHSDAMTFMFLYPLLGGVLVFLMAWLWAPAADALRRGRAAYNLYNAGIATLTTGSMLLGILEIAGTSSPYQIVYRIAGGLLASAGLSWFLFLALRNRRKPRSFPAAESDYPYRPRCR